MTPVALRLILNRSSLNCPSRESTASGVKPCASLGCAQRVPVDQLAGAEPLQPNSVESLGKGGGSGENDDAENHPRHAFVHKQADLAIPEDSET